MKKITRESLKESLAGPDNNNWLLRAFWLWLITGAVYFFIEGLWRIHSNGGWANIIMMPIGGLCGVLVGVMNENPKYCKKKMALQSLYGMACVVVVEFACGMILNVALKMDMWDYSKLPVNVLGQICLPFAILWFLLTPFIIWFDDYLRYKLWGEGKPYRWYANYIELITGK